MNPVSSSMIPSLSSSTISNIHHQCISTFKDHSSYVFSLVISGKFLYSGSSDKEILLHIADPSSNSNQNLSSQSKVVAIGEFGSVKSLVISGDKLFSAHQDHKIRVWQIPNNFSTPRDRKFKLLATLPTLTDRLLRFLPAKNYVQVRRHKKTTWVHHVDTISALALSKDESLLYSVSWDRTLKIWRSSDFTCLESVNNAHDDAINALVCCKNGFVFTGSADKKIKIWKNVIKESKSSNARKKKKHSVVAVLDTHKSAVNALALSTDGCVLYSGGCDCQILVWDITYTNDGDYEDNQSINMSLVGALKGHKRAVLCLSVISDLICSGSADKTVRIWRRINNGSSCSYSCLAVMEGHNGPVKCLTTTIEHNYSNSTTMITNNAYLIYSGSLDCSIKVWKILVPYSL
ncbi:protein JINGUBANG-like [Papaver somniferum]|uniref:protein JINGUBANG-like n=1 Tax=Papaver somniferum TaxID=3469 RepID=UPI000E7031AA|nr:protein JINGUBANG-like [Papaver somniferum]